ncbi:translation elongation factor Ts [Actinospongicola halichondriae]|uniref:translation elongation factor Ts n=1 Tax=Actinospongicola halichondriae TaxID=3236844 RepID=UPI003D561AA1
MAEFTAKDVQALRQATGAGMMDAKKALVEAEGDFDAAAKKLREKGLAKAATRADRDNVEGVVAVADSDAGAAIIQLKSETDFSAKSDDFVALAQAIADAVAAGGPSAADGLQSRIDDLKVTLKENIELGSVTHVAKSAETVIDTYVHVQDGRGVNGVITVLEGGDADLAHDISIHIAFTKPAYLTRDEVPQAAIDEERETLTEITRKEGKPEAALEKIVEGKLGGWFRDQVLIEQKFVRDEKQTIEKLLGDAKLVKFEQVVIGA